MIQETAQYDYQRFIIQQIREETETAKTFVLLPSDTARFQYKAGQFITLIFREEDVEKRRSYSFSSSPVLNEPPQITVKRIPNGEFSRKLIDTMQPGDELITTEAAGFFVLPDQIKKNHRFVFLAAGSGITPVFSLLKTILFTMSNPCVLLYSNRSQRETIFFDALEDLRQQFRHRLVIEYLFSTSPDLTKARLNRATLIHLLQQQVFAITNTLFYICGPSNYMRMAEIELLSERVSPSQIRKEHFSQQKPLQRNEPADKRQHHVQLFIHGQQYNLQVQFPVSILQAAKQKGIMLPYSCEVGKCGSCVAKCIKGRVWMMYNEVLTENELQKGLVLTCNGYPVDGDVVLSFNEH